MTAADIAAGMQGPFFETKTSLCFRNALHVLQKSFSGSMA
jgi:hypothetical protein